MRHLMLAVALAGCGGSDGDPDCVGKMTAAAAYQHKDGNGSYKGRSCVESQCHLQGALGAMADPYHAGGTVVTKDGDPAAGITVRFEPLSSSAHETVAITDTDGNFFVPMTVPSPFPSIPTVTACPDLSRMKEGAQDPSYGSCAAASCHNADSGRGPIVLGL
jgi:hypothetical protein